MSSVFRISLDFQNTVVVCDFLGAQCLRDELLYNIQPESPAESKNKFISETERRKTLMSEYLKHCRFELTTARIIDIINVQFLKISHVIRKQGDAYESQCSHFVLHFVCKVLLDRQLKQEKVERYLDALRGGIGGLNIERYILSKVRGSKRMQQFFYHQPTMTEADKDYLVNEVAFYLVYNCYFQIHRLMVNSTAVLLTLDDEKKESLENESRAFYKFSDSEVESMPMTEAFVMEIYRLFPPTPVAHTDANKSFQLQSKSGSFEIEKDTNLLVRLDCALRDRQVFNQPDRINLMRYTLDSSLTNYIRAFMVKTSAGRTEDLGTWLLVWMTTLITLSLFNCKIQSRDPVICSTYAHESKRDGFCTDAPLDIAKFCVLKRRLIDWK